MPYLVTQIVDVHKKDEVVIQLNSGKFYVSVAKELEGTLHPDDEVLVERRERNAVYPIGEMLFK